MFPLPSNLSKVQQQVLTLLASGSTINEAAAAASVHRNTIANWRRSSEAFRHQWHTMQYEQAMHWRDELQPLVPVAFEVLQDLLTDPKTPPSVRLRAALAVISRVTAPPPPQPEMRKASVQKAVHNDAQPSPQTIEELEEGPTEPLVHTAQAQRVAQCCTTPQPDEAELERLIDQLTAPPVPFPRPSGQR